MNKLVSSLLVMTVIASAQDPVPDGQLAPPPGVQINFGPLPPPNGPEATRVVMDGRREKLHVDVTYYSRELNGRIAVYVDLPGEPTEHLMVGAGLVNPTPNGAVTVHYQYWLPEQVSGLPFYNVTVILWGPPTDDDLDGRQLAFDFTTLCPPE